MEKMIKKIFQGEIKNIDEDEKTLVAVVSTDVIDRMNESLDPMGADLAHFKQNPIVLFAHKYDEPPIAKALWIKRSKEGITSKMQFANTAFAQEIFELYKGGFMKAFSVGFLPNLDKIIEKTDDDGGHRIRKYLDWELLEYSAVPVPANPEALMLAIQKGILKDKNLKKMIEDDYIIDNNDICADSNPLPKIKIKNDVAFLELLAECKLLKENVELIEKENNALRVELYKAKLPSKQETVSEISDDVIIKIIKDEVVGEIRRLQGKVD